MLFRSVLLKEMQSLALDVHVQSDDGREVEVREEDDELLKAAEELGIDLTPVAARVAAAEVVAEAEALEEGAAAEVDVEAIVLLAEESDEADDDDGDTLPVGDLDEEVAEVEVED